MPNSIEMWLAPGVGHGLGDGQRMHAVVPVLVDLDEPEVLGALAAHAGAGDDGGVLAQFGRPLDAGVCHGFARGDHGELREAVHEVGAAVFEIGLMASSCLTSAPFWKRRLVTVGGFDRPDAAAALRAATRRIRRYSGPAR